MFGNVDKEDLITAFVNFLPEREVELTKEFKSGPNKNIQPILDTFFEYGIYEKPTKGNISNLVFKAAKAALIKVPCFKIQSLIKGMGLLWKKLSPDILDFLFDCTTSLSETVIEHLEPKLGCQKDQSVFTWLNRYIRSCTKTQLQMFVRFITGSSNSAPGTIIQVQFVDQPIDYLMAVSQTFFKILTLPRQFNSFSHLKEVINSCINSAESWSVFD